MSRIIQLCHCYINMKTLPSCAVLLLAAVYLWHGVTVSPVHGIRLVCPNGLVTPVYWTLGHPSSYRHSQIVKSTRVEEPWNSRGWNVDMTNGDLVIPEVKLSDLGEYYCGNNTNPIPVSLGHYDEVVVSSGDDVRLVCPYGRVNPMYWTYGHTRIVYPTRMKEPWKSRRWYVDTANGDLVIPEVIRSDEGEYFCGDNAGARRVRLWVELSVQDVVVTLGESISLVCPSGLSTPMSWAFGDSLVANYTTSPVSPINVVEPWKHRQWNMSITNGDLIIPEVKESDGGVYYCSHHIQVSLGGHSHDIPVSLWVIPRLHVKVVFRGDAVRLSCPHKASGLMVWAWRHSAGIGGSQIASYNTLPTSSIVVNEPWKSRGWNMDTTNGDLIIPEIMFVDEHNYFCGGTSPRPVILSVHVRPSLFTLEATPMPVEFNTNFKGICTVNEIRPEPSEFYWMLGDTRIQGLSNSSVVNSTYDVLSVYSTVTHIAIVDDFDKTLTCVLVMQNGGELRRSMQIVVNHGNMLVIGLPLFVVLSCLVFAVIIGIVLVHKRKIADKEDSNSTNRHVINPVSAPQDDNDGTALGVINITHVYGNERFDASQHGLGRIGDSIKYVTHPSHLQYGNMPPQQHVYERVN